MGFLKELRLRLGATMQQMADRCQVSRQHWSDIEAGRVLPTPEVAGHLSCFGLVPCTNDTLSARQLRTWETGCPYNLERVNPEPWDRAIRNWGYRLDLDGRIREWLMTMIVSESGLESCGWFQLAALNARPLIENPHTLGYRELPIMDRQGKVLGERCLPGICGNWGGLRFMAWPQVSLRPGNVTYRADGLLWLREGKRSAWGVLEFDGPTHNLPWDAERKRLLGMAEIRFSHDEVKGFRVGQRFREQAQGVLLGR
jgi:DNA-binding XRE family transcriptional regulator